MALYIVGNAAQNLTQRYARTLGMSPFEYTVTHFADTEIALSFPEHMLIDNAQILLIYQFQSGTDINAALFELLMVTTHLRMRGVATIIGILPYLPYARQERTIGLTAAGAPIFRSLLTTAGIDELVAADTHDHGNRIVGPSPYTSLSCVSWWADVIRNHFKKEIENKTLCLVAPDKGAQAYVAAIGAMLNAPTALITKQRLHQDHATALSLHGNVNGMTVLIVDDIVDTGHTALSACDLLLASNAASVSACFTHAILSPGALDRLAQSPLDRIFLTNTVREQALTNARMAYADVHDFLAAQLTTTLPTILKV